MSYGSSFKHGYPIRISPDNFRSDRSYMRIPLQIFRGLLVQLITDQTGTISALPPRTFQEIYERREIPESDSDRGWSKYGLLRTGTSVKVPESDKAKLMYYVACICSILDLTNVPKISRMCDFCNYYMLREQETNYLLLLCYQLNPDLLIGKCMFKDEEICSKIQNEFYELSYFQKKFSMSPTVTVLGEPRR
ncbi:hypothetical protein KUTeg_021600, partial [Tegillarca granosa]